MSIVKSNMSGIHQGILDDCLQIDSGEMERIVTNSILNFSDSGDINRLIAAADLEQIQSDQAVGQRQTTAVPSNTPAPPSTGHQNNIRRQVNSLPGTIGMTAKKDKPYIEIIEQPRSRGLRFRYTCEGRSAGSIPGVNSTTEKKTFPAIKIHNYTGPAVVVVSCVTNDSPKPKPHPHTLVGKDCTQGVCNLKVRETSVISFPHIGIQCARKSDVKEQMESRKKINVDPYQTGFDHIKDIDLKIVKLCFQVFLPGPQGTFTHIVPPVCSNAILDKKAHNELVICRIDHTSGRARGGDEVFLLCEKVTKDDITVKFYEVDNGVVVWEDIADFGSGDVHRQFAIVFRTPPYKDTAIRSPKQVYLQLHRSSDNEVSESIAFTYMPEDQDPHQIEEKRKRKCQQYVNLINEAEPTAPTSSAEVRERIRRTAFRKLKIKEETNPSEVGCEVPDQTLGMVAGGGFQSTGNVSLGYPNMVQTTATHTQMNNPQEMSGVDYQIRSIPTSHMAHSANLYTMSNSTSNPIIEDVIFNQSSGQIDVSLLNMFLGDNLGNDTDMPSVNLSGDVLSSNFEITPLGSGQGDMVDNNHA